MTFDLGDLLVLIGTVLLLVGLYLIDPRLALVCFGALVMALGLARLRAGGHRE